MILVTDDESPCGPLLKGLRGALLKGLARAHFCAAQVTGADVSLFDMCGGRIERSEAFANAPDHWQDCGPQGSPRFHPETKSI